MSGNGGLWLGLGRCTSKTLKLFQNFISYVTTSETEIKVFQLLKDFLNYFNIISATLNVLEIIYELQ